MAERFNKIKYFVRGLRNKVAVDNVHDTAPTIAQLTTAFGAPSTLGAGWQGSINDAAGGVNYYKVETDGTNWFFVKMTKAA